jgi:hypothetical protein
MQVGDPMARSRSIEMSASGAEMLAFATGMGAKQPGRREVAESGTAAFGLPRGKADPNLGKV